MNFTQPLHILLPEFQSFLVVASRTGGIVAAIPMLSGRTVPPRVKVALVLMLAPRIGPGDSTPSDSTGCRCHDGGSGE